MDVLDLLKEEDDNPRGRGSNFVSGSTLEEVAAAEERRRQIKAQRWPIGRQEAGILHLIQAKTLFQRLKLPEPRWEDGLPRWNVPAEKVHAAYEDMKKCCHPEWYAHHATCCPPPCTSGAHPRHIILHLVLFECGLSNARLFCLRPFVPCALSLLSIALLHIHRSFHPKRERGYTLLREAVDTLSDANGRRDEYVRSIAERVRERDEILAAAASGNVGAGASSGFSSSAPHASRATLSAAAAADAAELEQQFAAKRKRMNEERLRRAAQANAAGASSVVAGGTITSCAVPGPRRPSTAGPQRPTAPDAEQPHNQVGDDDGDDDYATLRRERLHANASKSTKKRRIGMF